MKLITHEKIIEKHYGARDSQEREEFENYVELLAVGAKVREMRKAAALTQTQLAERVGVGRAQISKIETDMKDLKLSTVLKVFRALGKEVRLVVD